MLYAIAIGQIKMDSSVLMQRKYEPPT